MAPHDSMTLILDPDNPCNTNIVDEDDGRIMYQVSTEYGTRTVTRVRDNTGEMFACWEWNPKSDMIAIRQGPPTPVNAWLRRNSLPFTKDTYTLQDNQNRTLRWKGLGTGLPLELYLDQDKKTSTGAVHKVVSTPNNLPNHSSEIVYR